MTQRTRNVLAGCGAAALLGVAGLATADPIEAVFGAVIEDEGAFVAATDRLFESEDMDKHRMTLWTATADGNDPATHVYVLEWDDYEAIVTEGRRRNASPDWQQYVTAATPFGDTVSSMFVIQRVVDGEGWRTHASGAAFMMTVRDPATYTAAFRRLIAATENPGSVRLMEVRAGGMGATHVVVITAPGFVELNEYLDELLVSEAYATFVGEVGAIRDINTVNMYRRIKSWGE